MSCRLLLCLLLAGSVAAHAFGMKPTLKIFVLAGQSNMEGHAEVATINKTSGLVKNGMFLSP